MLMESTKPCEIVQIKEVYRRVGDLHLQKCGIIPHLAHFLSRNAILQLCKNRQTWDFGGLLAGAVSVAGPAGVLAERLFGGDGQAEGVPVADLRDLVLPGVQGLSVFVPGHVSLGWRVDHTDHFGLVSLSRMDECLLLVNLGTVWNVI